VLSRKLAQKSHYPAVDVLQSISRLAITVAPEEVTKATNYTRKMMAIYGEAEDLINVGAYVKGSNPEIDEAIDKMPVINKFLQQEIKEKSGLEETFGKLGEIAGISMPQGEKVKDEEVPVST